MTPKILIFQCLEDGCFFHRVMNDDDDWEFVNKHLQAHGLKYAFP